MLNSKFCFTTDLDWASESMIAETLELFDKYNTPLSVFITHDSDIISKAYSGDKARHVGLHPNFLLNTTQGNSIENIVDNLAELWPDARCYRNHAYLDHIQIVKLFYDKGLVYDSNLLSHLQPNLIPLSDYGDMVKFPIWLEDNAYLRREKICAISHIGEELTQSGLKIFDFHPVHIAMNTPSITYYEQNKNIRGEKYGGSGIRSFVMQLLQYVKDNNIKTYYLNDLYEEIKYV